MVANWTFLTNHARVLLSIAHDPGARRRDIAASAGIAAGLQLRIRGWQVPLPSPSQGV